MFFDYLDIKHLQCIIKSVRRQFEGYNVKKDIQSVLLSSQHV